MQRAATGLASDDGRHFRAIAWNRAIARAYACDRWPAWGDR